MDAQKITELAQADVVAWEEEVQQAVAVRKSAANLLRLAKKSEVKAIENRGFFKRSWNNVQGIGTEGEADEPKKKIARKVSQPQVTKVTDFFPKK